MLKLEGKSMITLNINNDHKSILIRPGDTLLYVIREQLGLTGTKNGCENGDCDGCTVLVDGMPIKSCLMLAAEAIGHHVITIEGLHNAPIQKAFVEKFAIQCGYCTPGFIMNCQGLINMHPRASDEIIDEWLESNLCRCTGYEEIRSAIKSVLNTQ